MKPTYTHLEDFSEDIIAKAQNGLRVTNRDLSDRSGVDLTILKALKNGECDEAALRKIAPVLNLDPDRLVTAARKAWMPAEQDIPGLEVFVSQFRTMSVNAYLLSSPAREGILFDTGVDPDPILQHIEEKEIRLQGIVLTHGHPDHIAVLDPILSHAGGLPVFAHPAENISGARPVSWGDSFSVGSFRIRALSTPGHTAGGTSFLVEGLQPPLAIVGDAIFAGSVGGCAADYANALAAIRENLLCLPAETVLCPGHGPLTTVAEEKSHNPFFPS